MSRQAAVGLVGTRERRGGGRGEERRMGRTEGKRWEGRGKRKEGGEEKRAY